MSHAVLARRAFTGLARTLLAAALVGLPLWYFSARYQIGYERTRGASCLSWDLYLIDRWDHHIEAGNLVAFRAMAMEPFYARGTPVVKIAAGIPGSQVTVNAKGVSVDGQYWGALAHAKPGGRLYKLGHRLSEYAREATVPAGYFFVTATHPRSFDSRYWGDVSMEDVIGRAYPIW